MTTMTRRPVQALLLASLLAASALTVTAQTPPPAPPAAAQAAGPHGHRDHGGHKGHHDPAKIQAKVAQRLAALKAKLAITPAQEGAWTAFASTMTPPAQPPARPDRVAFEKMTTPERIDRLQALRAERQAKMDQRAAATKTFYAALTAEQKKQFDAESLRLLSRHGHGGRHGEHPRS